MPLPEIADYPAAYRYRFCPLCGQALETAFDGERNRLRCPRDGWTFYPTPNFAVTLVVEHDGGVVLLRRAIPPDAGIWHLPIGHAEFGEHPEDAALREARDETGLAITDPVFLDFEFSPSYGDPAMFYVVFCYAARSAGGVPKVNYENEEVRVFPADALPDLKWTSQRRALAAWRALRAGLPWQPGRRYEELGLG